jgi:hypothetical protein
MLLMKSLGTVPLTSNARVASKKGKQWYVRLYGKPHVWTESSIVGTHTQYSNYIHDNPGIQEHYGAA